MNAMEDLKEELEEGETIEAIVFGPWGWDDGGGTDEEEREDREVFVPREKRGVILTPKEALPYMEGWSFNGGFGAPDCYACRIWTNQRVLWVTQYDGATSLDSAPRNPEALKPDMPGGG